MLYAILWCVLSAIDVILNKRIVDVFPFPFTLTMVKLGIASLCYSSLWLAHVRSPPRKWRTEYQPLFCVVVFHTIGLSLVNMSLRMGSVFDNQTIRSAQSSVTLLLSIWRKVASPTLALVVVLGGMHHACTVPPYSVCYVTTMVSNVCFSLRGVYSNRIKWYDATPANNFGIITILSFLFMIPIALLMEGKRVKTQYVDTASAGKLESLLMEVCLCGFVYFISIEVAYAMFDPTMSSFGRTQRDVFRQAFTMTTATFYFEETVTQHMAIGYAIALIGQLLQAYGRTSPRELSRKNVSPKQQQSSSPTKNRKR